MLAARVEGALRTPRRAHGGAAEGLHCNACVTTHRGFGPILATGLQFVHRPSVLAPDDAGTVVPEVQHTLHPACAEDCAWLPCSPCRLRPQRSARQLLSCKVTRVQPGAVDSARRAEYTAHERWQLSASAGSGRKKYRHGGAQARQASRVCRSAARRAGAPCALSSARTAAVHIPAGAWCSARLALRWSRPCGSLNCV